MTELDIDFNELEHMDLEDVKNIDKKRKGEGAWCCIRKKRFGGSFAA